MGDGFFHSQLNTQQKNIMAKKNLNAKEETLEAVEVEETTTEETAPETASEASPATVESEDAYVFTVSTSTPFGYKTKGDILHESDVPEKTFKGWLNAGIIRKGGLKTVIE
jgi:hypothetical protein